jgi:hypothetical protein
MNSTVEVCSICNHPIPAEGPNGEWIHGRNAAPITGGRCCADCDNSYVIPMRIALAMSSPKVKRKVATELRKLQFNIAENKRIEKLMEKHGILPPWKKGKEHGETEK